MKISYNWIQSYFDKEFPEAEVVCDALIFHAFEIEDIETVGADTVFEAKILPDRAHDCLSHRGVAREVAAILDIPLAEKKIEPVTGGVTKLAVSIESEECRRYGGRIVRGVSVGPSPLWLKDRLEAIGQRSINNLVDATNYVLFNLGQPVHVFDLDKLVSEKIIIRNAREGESLTTLDGKDIALDESVLVIADDENVLALAGVKGGTKAEVDEHTKNIVIEVANFAPVSTRKTARRLNLLTDAAKRFENDLSPELVKEGMDAITALILELAGGESETVVDVYPAPQPERKIEVTAAYLNAKLGAAFSADEIESVWKRLGFAYVRSEDRFAVTVPPLRLDLKEAHDLVEEVGRILGYDKLVPEIPDIDFAPAVNDTFYRSAWVRKTLAGLGYREVLGYTFTKKGVLEVARGAKGKEALRTNLADGLKAAYEMNRLNAPLLGVDEVKIFEIGTVFPEKDKEEIHVTWADKTGVKEETLESFTKDVSLAGSYDTVLFSTNYQLQTTNFAPWSPYPFISRDIALWVPRGVESSEVYKVIKENAGELLLGEPRLFDEFEKEGRKSYAFRLVFQSLDRTLTDDEVSRPMEKITAALTKNPDWEIR